MDVVDDEDDTLVRVGWLQRVLALLDVLLLNLLLKSIPGEVGCHWDRYRGHRCGKLLLKCVQDDGLGG